LEYSCVFHSNLGIHQIVHKLYLAHHGSISPVSCDIWAMGVTLYCMAFGRLPFQGNSIVQLYENIKNQPYDISFYYYYHYYYSFTLPNANDYDSFHE